MIATHSHARTRPSAPASPRAAAVPSLITQAAHDAGWHPATERRTLLEFLQAEAARDPSVLARLHAHLDDAVAGTFRAHTAFKR